MDRTPAECLLRRDTDAGGHVGEQLGVHGDGRAGVDGSRRGLRCGRPRRAPGPHATRRRKRPCCASNSKRFCRRLC
jgi:hypothetical protein